METYTEEEYKKHSGTHLDEDEEDDIDGDEEDASDGSSESELDLEMEQLDGSSIEFQSGTFSEESFGSNLSEEDSDSYLSANEDVIFQDESVLSPAKPARNSSPKKGAGPPKGKEEEEGGVFIDNFSDDSEDGEGRNMLGKLETQVMNLSISRFRL